MCASAGSPSSAISSVRLSSPITSHHFLFSSQTWVRGVKHDRQQDGKPFHDDCSRAAHHKCLVRFCAVVAFVIRRTVRQRCVCILPIELRCGHVPSLVLLGLACQGARCQRVAFSHAELIFGGRHYSHIAISLTVTTASWRYGVSRVITDSTGIRFHSNVRRRLLVGRGGRI